MRFAAERFRRIGDREALGVVVRGSKPYHDYFATAATPAFEGTQIMMLVRCDLDMGKGSPPSADGPIRSR